jgi:hypothetical protein
LSRITPPALIRQYSADLEPAEVTAPLVDYELEHGNPSKARIRP